MGDSYYDIQIGQIPLGEATVNADGTMNVPRLSFRQPTVALCDEEADGDREMILSLYDNGASGIGPHLVIRFAPREYPEILSLQLSISQVAILHAGLGSILAMREAQKRAASLDG